MTAWFAFACGTMAANLNRDYNLLNMLMIMKMDKHSLKIKNKSDGPKK
jgi:hypothetical protein